MPPKVPINGFAVFMYEMKDRRRLNMSGGQLSTFCGPLWKELSAAEKKQYDARAKELKGQKKGAEGDMSRRDNVGNIIGMRKNPEEEGRKRRQRDQDMVTREWPRKDLTEERFYFINFQDLCELTEPDNTTEREWLPREFAIVEFSLRHGIMQHYHVFINPGGIPKGFRYTCIQKSEETHRIPIEDFEHDTADYSLIWRKMKEVMRAGVKDGLYPPVFCLDSDHEKMKYLMDWLWMHSDDFALDDNLVGHVCAIEDLVVNLLAYSNQPNTEQISSNSVVTKLDGSHWDFIPNTSCDWHEDQDTKYCALGIVRRYAFTISDILAQVYNINLTDRHVPTRTSSEEVARVLPPDAMPSVFNQQRKRSKGRTREGPGSAGDSGGCRIYPPHKLPQTIVAAVEHESEFVGHSVSQQKPRQQTRPEASGGMFFGPRTGQPFGHREVPLGPATGQFDDWPELGSGRSSCEGDAPAFTDPSKREEDASSQMSSLSLAATSSAWLTGSMGRGNVADARTVSTIRPPPGIASSAFGPVPDPMPRVGRGLPMQQEASRGKGMPLVGRGSAPVGRGAPPPGSNHPQEFSGQYSAMLSAGNPTFGAPDSSLGSQGFTASVGRGAVPMVGHGALPSMGRGSVLSVGRGLPVSDFSRDATPSVGRGITLVNSDDNFEPPAFEMAGVQGGRGVVPGFGRGMPVSVGQGFAPSVGRGMPGSAGISVGRGYLAP